MSPIRMGWGPKIESAAVLSGNLFFKRSLQKWLIPELHCYSREVKVEEKGQKSFYQASKFNNGPFAPSGILDDLHKPFLSFYSCTNHRFLFLQLCTPFCRLLRLLSQFLLEKSKGLLFGQFLSHVFLCVKFLAGNGVNKITNMVYTWQYYQKQ